jgi:hypothetical protein
MITARHVNERLSEEKEPVQYIDGEVARRLDQMSSRFENIQETIAAFNNREDKNDPFDLQYIKDDLRNAMEMYTEINVYLKVRKEQVKRRKRAENLSKAQVKRREPAGQAGKKNRRATP